LLVEHGVNGLMQISRVERKVFPDALFEGKPPVLNGVEVWGVGGQEFLRAAGPCNEVASFGGLLEAGVVIEHQLARLEDRHQPGLNIGVEERGRARALEHKGRNEDGVMEGINQTHSVGAMAGLLAPARFAPWAPALRTGCIISHTRLIAVHQLLYRDAGQLGAKLFSQLFVPLGVAKGLFLCG
jgi:hypothetical protein